MKLITMLQPSALGQLVSYMINISNVDRGKGFLVDCSSQICNSSYILSTSFQ